MYIKDISRLAQNLARFVAFVQYKDSLLESSDYGFISFRDSNGFLGMEEDYKSFAAESARKELAAKEWKEDWIGTGKIAERAIRAISQSGNLVNHNQQISFRNRLDPKHKDFQPEGERAIFDIYRGNNEKIAFKNAIKIFGAKYDTISFLFFIKDDTRFLPISPGNFDKSFALLGVDYRTSYKCGWDNYLGFISIIDEIREIMDDMLPLKAKARLIDAHSFVWVIHEKQFLNWNPTAKIHESIEKNTEDYLEGNTEGLGKKKRIISQAFDRNAEVAKIAKTRANGVCQLCGNQAPFIDKKGHPYLESHHVIWLSRGGEDSIKNVVALCPNCHTKMHVLDNPEDVSRLSVIATGTYEEDDK